jgi:hypothetical protein
MEMNVGHERIFLGENVTSGVSFLVFLLGIFARYGSLTLCVPGETGHGSPAADAYQK